MVLLPTQPAEDGDTATPAPRPGGHIPKPPNAGRAVPHTSCAEAPGRHQSSVSGLAYSAGTEEVKASSYQEKRSMKTVFCAKRCVHVLLSKFILLHSPLTWGAIAE